MDRRTFLGALTGVGIYPAQAGAATPPWAMRLLKGGFDGERHLLGVHLILQHGWKTYWRVPGTGGIPPAITVAGSNMGSFTFDCPLPQRYPGEEGETIGYTGEVVFPVSVTPGDPRKPLEVIVNVFAGVCERVCIPALFEEEILLSPVLGPLAESALLQLWQARVPAKVRTPRPVESVLAQEEHLLLRLVEPVRDIFVEFLDGPEHYALAPEMSEPHKAVIHLPGLKSGEGLRGRRVRLTSALEDSGVEQDMTVG